jgi:DNA-binding PadR family transcriptional regulator
MKQDHLQGTLELVILKTLATAPNHGFGITLHVQEASAGLLRVEEGSLYPALHRLEKQNSSRANGRKRKTPAEPAFTPSLQPANDV